MECSRMLGGIVILWVLTLADAEGITDNSGGRPRWVVSEFSFSPCDCATATRLPLVTCRAGNQSASAVLDDSRCDASTRPVHAPTPCPQSCPHQWVVSPYSQCSAVCGGGEQTRSVFCGNPHYPEYRAEDFHCLSRSWLPRPTGHRRCGLLDCPAAFIATQWSRECHVHSLALGCGVGFNVRGIGCERRLANGATADSDACGVTRAPHTTRECYKPCTHTRGLENPSPVADGAMIEEAGRYFVNLGDSLTLSCQSNCTSSRHLNDTSVTWTLNGVDVTELRSSKRPDRFRIRRYGDEDMGGYRCHSYSPHGGACARLSGGGASCPCVARLQFSLITHFPTEFENGSVTTNEAPVHNPTPQLPHSSEACDPPCPDGDACESGKCQKTCDEVCQQLRRQLDTG